jgi:hypothetical protein
MLPETPTVTPRGPEVRVREIVAVFVTVNVAEAMSDPALPVAITEYGPSEAVPLTVNEQLREMVPLKTVHMTPLAPSPAGTLDRVTFVSAGLNVLPETITVVPGGPEVGLSVIEAVLAVTVNVADAGSKTTLPVPVTV